MKNWFFCFKLIYFVNRWLKIVLDLVANASAGFLRKIARISKYKIDCVVPSNLKYNVEGRENLVSKGAR